jgi:two-component system cell cycle sensor histidine kinase/response regulator CckA
MCNPTARRVAEDPLTTLEEKQSWRHNLFDTFSSTGIFFFSRPRTGSPEHCFKRKANVKLTLSNSTDANQTIDPLSDRTVNRRVRNAAIFVAGALVYWGLASLVPYFAAENIVRLTPFFVGAAGYFLGIGAGAAAGMAAIVIHSVLLNRLGYDGPLTSLQVGAAAHIVILSIGLLMGHLHNVRKRLRAESAAREAIESQFGEVESRFCDIVDAARDVFWIISADWSGTIYVSPAFESVFGIPIERFTNNPRSLLDIVHDDDRAALLEVWESIPDDDRQFEYRIKRPDGTTRWIHSRAIAIHGNDGVVQRIAGVSGDVTDRKNAEDALSAGEKRYRSLFEDDLAGDFVATPGGRIVTCNQSFARLLGFESVEETLSVSAPSLFPSDEDWNEFLRRLTTERKLTDYEGELRARNSGVVYVLGNFVAGFDDEGSLAEIKGYVFDNTARKRLEQQLFHAQKMEAIGRLAGGIAHDFNNSLTSISGYNELLLNKLEPDSPLYRYSQEVMKAADRAAGLTRRLLAFGRRQIIQPKIIDVNSIVQNMDGVLRRTIGEDIEMETRAQADEPTIEADPSLVETIILNLAINARDAMASGGKLTIRTENVTVTEANRHKTPGIEPGGYVLISVTDTGVGMDEETQSKVFEPFFTTKEQGKGTGLGLSTVYGAVSQSGGYVRVSSQPGRGATFKLYFPNVENRLPISAKRETFFGPSMGTEVVLVAEDEPPVQRLIRDVLENKGYRVLIANDGTSALQVAADQKGRIDLLIADVVMPQMNGRELAAQLRSECPRLKVLFISGYIGKASMKVGELGPGTSFLSKPFSSGALARKIRLLLDAPPSERLEPVPPHHDLHQHPL